MTELKKEGGESFRQGQRNKLPVTTSSVVTEAPRQILGLKNFGIFAVFLAFAFIVILTNHFPSALIGAVATFTFIKVFIKGSKDSLSSPARKNTSLYRRRRSSRRLISIK